MRLKKILLIAGAIVVAAGAAIAIAVYTLDPRTVAATLAASVKADTGRELTFGNVEVKLFPRPALVVSDLRFANAAGGSQPWMAVIQRLQADIGVAALLSGQIRVNRIAVSDASLLLETDAKGNGNWVMGETGGAPPAWLSRLEIDNLTLKPYQFMYRNGATGETTRFTLDSATLEAPVAGAPIRLHVQGHYAGAPVVAKASIGGLAALLANGAAYPVDVEGSVATAAFTLRGTVDQPLDTGNLNLTFNAQGPEISTLAALAGEKVRPLGKFRAAATLTGLPGAPVLTGIDVEVGAPESIGFTASGSIEATAPGSGTLAWISKGLDVKVQGTQLHDLGELIGKPLPPLGPYKMAGRLSGSVTAPALSGIDVAIGSRGHLELEVRGAATNLRAGTGIDVNVAASAAEWWRIDGQRLPPFRVRGRLRDARQGYTVDGLEAHVAGNALNASLTVATDGPRPRIVARATSPAIDLARLLPKAEAASAATRTPARSNDHWRLADLDLDLQIGRLVLPDARVVQTIAGRVALANGRLTANGLQATLGGARVKLDGTATDPGSLAGLDATFSLQGTELADLFRFFGGKLPPTGPYRGQATARGSLAMLELSAIDASVGRTGQRLRATGTIKDTLNWKGADLTMNANVADSVAFGQIFGTKFPKLPAIRANARMTGPEGGYAFDNLRVMMGRSTVQGRVAIAPGAARPRVTLNLTGSQVDLSEIGLTGPTDKVKAEHPLLAADVDADLRFDRVFLPDRRALGPLSGKVQLVDGALSFTQFAVAVDGASATIDGKIAAPATPSGIDLTINAKVDRVSGIEKFFTLDLPDLPAFTASGRVTDVRDGYAVGGLKLGYGVTTVDGDVAVTRGPRRFKVTAKISAPIFEVPGFVTAAAADGAAAVAPSGGRLIPDTPLPLDLLRAIDADLDVRIEKLKFGDATPLGPVLVKAVITDGRLTADPVQVTIQATQTLNVTGSIDASNPKSGVVALNIDGTGIDFGEFLARTGRKGSMTGGLTDFQLRMTGRGTTPRAVLGGMNGSLRMSTGPAVIHNLNFNLGVGLLQGVINFANPFRSTDPDTSLKCFATNVKVQDGLISFDRSIALETARFNMVMSGTVNLRTEALDFGVTPIVTQGLGIGSGELTRLVRVRGTMANPQMGMNAVGAARTTASLGLAVWTFGGSLLLDSLVRRATNDPNPCATALAQ